MDNYDKKTRKNYVNIAYREETVNIECRNQVEMTNYDKGIRSTMHKTKEQPHCKHRASRLV